MFVLAVAATTFVACNKDDSSKLPDQTKTVNFIAGAPTKTTFGTVSAGKYPTIWTGNESNVKVAQNISTCIDAAVAKVSDTQANFAASFTDDASGSYTFYAVSPASAVVSGINSSYSGWNIEIPNDQTPTTSGPDEKAMIMVATSETVNEFPATVSLDFKHFTAYGKMSVTYLALDSGDEIASVLITASQNIAYRYKYTVSGADTGKIEENGAQNSINIHTTSASDIWFACAPMAAGTTFDVAITTANSKVYTKTGIAIPAALEAGHIAEFNVNFSGISAATDEIYTLVTEYSQLTSGSKVIVASVGDTYYAMGVVPAEGTFASAVATPKSADDQTITNPASTVDVFTLEAGSVANTVAFNGTNGYITSYSGSNYVKATSTKDKNSSFSVEILDDSTGEISLQANGTYVAKDLRYNYNNGNPRFSLYKTDNTTLAHPALYKLEGSGDDASTLLLPQLDTPTNLQTEISGSNITVSWDAVTNADNYLVTCTGQTDQTVTTTSVVFSGLEDGLYTITVKAISADHSVRIDSKAATTTATLGTVSFADVHTSNVTLKTTETGSKSVAECKIVINSTEYDGLKAGTGKVKGEIAIAVPSGKTKLYFHAAAWSGSAVTTTLSSDKGTLNSTSLTADTGVSNNSPFTIANYQNSMYFTLELPSNPSGTTIVLKSTVNRFVVWGVNVEP